MNSEVLQDLERKIDEAIEVIVGLRKEKEKLETENQSLRGQIESFKTIIEEQKEKLKNEFSGSPGSNGDSHSQEIKRRLKKLAVRLAALEDSWN